MSELIYLQKVPCKDHVTGTKPDMTKASSQEVHRVITDIWRPRTNRNAAGTQNVQMLTGKHTAADISICKLTNSAMRRGTFRDCKKVERSQCLIKTVHRFF